MIISYAWTTDALLAGRKTVTRRDWSKEYAVKFRPGTVHQAYDRNPRIHGKKVGDVLIIRAPYPERTCDIPDTDYEEEGLKYMEQRGLLIRGMTPREFFENWRASKQVLFVVRFALVIVKTSEAGDTVIEWVAKPWGEIHYKCCQPSMFKKPCYWKDNGCRGCNNCFRGVAVEDKTAVGH